MTADLITSLNAVAAVWWTWFAAVTWQASLFIAIVAIADRVFGRFIWPQVRYAVWLLAFVKLVLPPTLASQLSVVGRLVSSRAVSVPTSTSVAEWSVPVTDAVTTSSSVIATGYVEPVLPGLDRQVVMLLVWLAGFCVFLSLIAVKIYIIKIEMLNADDPTPELLQQLEETSQRAGLRRTPKLCITEAVPSAAVMGLLHPTLLIPPDFAHEKTDSQAIQHVFLHEIAHIKRSDLVVHVVSVVLLAMFWPNPLVWYALKRAGQIREICTDATVSAILREETPAYRATLLNAARAYIDQPTATLNPLRFLGLVEGPTMMMERLRNLNAKSWKHSIIKRVTALAATLLLGLTVLPMCESNPSEVTGSDAVTGGLTTRGTNVMWNGTEPDTLYHDFAPILPARPDGNPREWSAETRTKYVQTYREAFHIAEDAAIAHLRQAIADGRITADDGFPDYPDLSGEDPRSRYSAIAKISKSMLKQIWTSSDIDGNLFAGVLAWRRFRSEHNNWGNRVYNPDDSPGSLSGSIDEPPVLIVPTETVYIDSEVDVGVLHANVVVGPDGRVEQVRGVVEQELWDHMLSEELILEVQRSATNTIWEPALWKGKPVSVGLWIPVQVAYRNSDN
jgi:beta-lactamase regulating signal transducer with metallopeptidase domain